MSFEVGQTVVFKKQLQINGHTPNMSININEGHTGKVVEVDEDNKYGVEVYDGLIVHRISVDLIERGEVNPTQEGIDKINSMTKKFHKEFFPDQKRAIKTPGFHPHKNEKEG